MIPQKQEADFVTLIEENQNIIHKICRLYTQSEAEHKDLFQEISIQLWRSFDRFEGKSKFSTWMYRVRLNTAITLYAVGDIKLETPYQALDFKHIEENPWWRKTSCSSSVDVNFFSYWDVTRMLFRSR